MSSILLLPMFGLTGGVQTDEDWLFAVEFTWADGQTPILLPSFIALTIQDVAVVSTAGGQITPIGTAGNVMLVSVPASLKAAWPPGQYPISLQVGDGTTTRDLLGPNSWLTIGTSQLPFITGVGVPYGTNAAIARLLSPSEISALINGGGGGGGGGGSVQHLSVNTTISAPGNYGLTAQSITITLPSVWPFLGGFTITDRTFAAYPAQMIVGPVNNGQPITFVNAGESMTFVWDSLSGEFIIL